MALMHTPICEFGWKAPDFSLPTTDGKTYSLDDIKGENGTLVMFICNHCPYVQRVLGDLVEAGQALKDAGIGVIAISANDSEEYPEDSFDNMKALAEQNGFPFPYAIDETQNVARAYDAICTPDFFGFNKNLELQYRGRIEEGELVKAMIQIAETGKGPEEQTPSMGCSIKWKNAAA